MPEDPILARIDDRRRHAIAAGALQPIRTSLAWIEDHGVRFPVRWIASLADKPRPSGPNDRRNPFLPWETDLEVDRIGAHHVALLNKFPVIERHLLLITRTFESQQAPLHVVHFAAAAELVTRAGGMVFYNGGRSAGASQPHRHLQWVPRDDALMPLLPELDRAVHQGRDRMPLYRFEHRLAPITLSGDALARAYGSLGDALALGVDRTVTEPYNLVLTSDWMLLIPRRCEQWSGISVNALGFVGSLFVGDPAEIDKLRRKTPLELLAEVAGPRSPSGGLG